MPGARSARGWPAASTFGGRGAAGDACRRWSTCGSRRRPTPAARRWSSEQTRGVPALAVPTGSEARLQVAPSAGGRDGRGRLSARPRRPFTDLGPGSGEADADARPRRRRWRCATARGRRSPSWPIDVAAGRGADRELRRRAARDPPQRAAGSISRPRTTMAWPSWRCCWRRRARGRDRAADAAQARQPAAQARDRHLSGPDRASARRPAGGAAAGGGRRDRPARPERPAGDRAAGARVPPSAGARDHRASGASWWRRPKRATRWRQPLGALGDTPGGPAAAGRGAAGAAGRVRRVWR